LGLADIIDSSKVLVPANLGYRSQYLSQLTFARVLEHGCEDIPMLGLGAAAVPSGAPLEGSY
jgi:hypothetical protein